MNEIIDPELTDPELPSVKKGYEKGVLSQKTKIHRRHTGGWF